MPTIKELKDELKNMGITKGLSRLTKAQLVEALRRAKAPLEIASDEDKKNLLRQIIKKDLLKVIRMIRIKNYSHLKHEDLVNLIVSKYWDNFQTRWLMRDDENIPLPYKPMGIRPEPRKRPKVVEQALKAMPSKPTFSEPKRKPKKKVEPVTLIRRFPEDDEREQEKPSKPKLTTAEATHQLHSLAKLPRYNAKKVLIDVIQSQKNNPSFFTDKINKQFLKVYIKDEKLLKKLGIQ
jgi:hypothetical protein